METGNNKSFYYNIGTLDSKLERVSLHFLLSSRSVAFSVIDTDNKICSRVYKKTYEQISSLVEFNKIIFNTIKRFGLGSRNYEKVKISWSNRNFVIIPSIESHETSPKSYYFLHKITTNKLSRFYRKPIGKNLDIVYSAPYTVENLINSVFGKCDSSHIIEESFETTGDKFGTDDFNFFTYIEPVLHVGGKKNGALFFCNSYFVDEKTSMKTTINTLDRLFNFSPNVYFIGEYSQSHFDLNHLGQKFRCSKKERNSDYIFPNELEGLEKDIFSTVIL